MGSTRWTFSPEAAAWFGYLAYAFVVVPGWFRLRRGRWPFVSPWPLTSYSAVEVGYALLYAVYSVALVLGPKPLSFAVGAVVLLGAAAF